MDRIHRFLRSDAAILLALVVALSAQMPHAAAVFHRLAPSTLGGAAGFFGWLHAAAYALALEAATLLFVVRGQRRLAWLFAAFSVAINLAYYWQVGWSLTAPTPDMLRAGLVCVCLPLAIAFYSHGVAGEGASVGHERVSEGHGVAPVGAWVGLGAPSVVAPSLIGAPSTGTPEAPEGLRCYRDGCSGEAEACAHGCGEGVCASHRGSHKQWHCTHEPGSKAYEGPPLRRLA